MNVSRSFMVEVVRFERCGMCSGPPRSGVGLAQFHARESRGHVPAQPDPYYQRLTNGKRWWEWTLNEYGKLYGTREWWGWATIEADFARDPAGLRQVRARVRGMARGFVPPSRQGKGGAE